MLKFKINKNNTACEVTKCDKKAAGLVTIPDTYSGKAVVSIGEEARQIIRVARMNDNGVAQLRNFKDFLSEQFHKRAA